MGAPGSGATCIRGVLCPKGHDEWSLRGKKFACAPCDRERSRRYQAMRYDVDPWWALWNSAKKRAADKVIEFHILPEHVEAAWPPNDCCPILGIPLVRTKGFSGDGSPTLDRINPSFGYEPNNIAILSQRANRAKNNLSAGELETIAQWMRLNGLD